jgi:hypothetical protein
MTTEKSRRRTSRIKAVIVAIVILLATGGSLTTYLVERSQGQAQVDLGDSSSPDRVDVSVFVQKVDAAAQEVTAQVEVSPQGSLADENGDPRQDLTVFTTGLTGDTLPFKAGKTPSVATVKVALNSGVITDYPFDSYQADFGFTVESQGTTVPISLSLVNADSFFKLSTKDTKTVAGAVLFSAGFDRSMGTFAFALFVMIFMWCLSLAAVIAAWFAISGRKGLLWPSMSFMGALLFALIPLRNAVPGQPPVGSVVDFASFFIAEALISVSLISTVVAGFLVERAKDRADEES